MSGRARVSWLLALLLVAAFAPLVAPESSQPASRFALTAAISEHHTIDIRGYPLGVDRAIYSGQLRSDKAPGQSMLAVPVYLVGRALGAESAAHLRQDGNLTLWWVTFWMTLLPFVGLVVLMYLAASRHAPSSTALAVAAGIGVGTMMLPHAVNLYGHDLAALFGFGAWLAIERVPSSARRAAFAGFLGAMAVVTEYQSAIILVALACYLIFRQRPRIGWFALGAMPPLAVLAWYQWAAFGAAWHTPSAYYAGTIGGTSSGGYSIPGFHDVGSVFFGGRGLLVGAPIALVALVGAVWLAISGTGRARRHASMAVAVLVPYLILCAGWSGVPILEEPGPRYLIPALPFLAVPLAATWDRLRRPALLAAVVGASIAVPATTTFVLLKIKQPPFPELFRRITHHEFLPTLWSMALDRLGLALYLASVVGCGAALLMQVRSTADERP